LLGSKLTNYLTIRVIEIENWRMGGIKKVSKGESEKKSMKERSYGKLKQIRKNYWRKEKRS
jgi:hypothetical protein